MNINNIIDYLLPENLIFTFFTGKDQNILLNMSSAK